MRERARPDSVDRRSCSADLGPLLQGAFDQVSDTERFRPCAEVLPIDFGRHLQDAEDIPPFVSGLPRASCQLALKGWTSARSQIAPLYVDSRKGDEGDCVRAKRAAPEGHE